MSSKSHRDTEGGVATETHTEKKLKRPRLYKVLLHNDDYTTMEFVVDVLKGIFNKPDSVATALMLAVHREGQCVAGVYTYEIAETKVAQVSAAAERAEYPFLCTMEPAEED
jgi:ATP-dependent Clp protease adaptor protein ClpS